MIKDIIRSRYAGLVGRSGVVSAARIVWTQYFQPIYRPSKSRPSKHSPQTISILPVGNTLEGIMDRIDRQRIFRIDTPLLDEIKAELKSQSSIYGVVAEGIVLVNHILGTAVIAHKSRLYRLLENTDGIVPGGRVVEGGENMERSIEDLKNYLNSKDSDQSYIIKPGENSNRGHGIQLAKGLDNIIRLVKDMLSLRSDNDTGNIPTVAVQEYIQRPLLYKGRKIDIRMYVLIGKYFGVMNTYFYRQGYVRTSSYPYTLDSPNLSVHLTNEGIQMNNTDMFGKYEPANKLYFDEFSQYLQDTFSHTQNPLTLSSLIAAMRVVTSPNPVNNPNSPFSLLPHPHQGERRRYRI